MKDLTPDDLVATIGKKISVSFPSHKEPVYLAIFGYESDSEYYWGYMMNPKTKELYHRFSSKLKGATKWKIIEDLSEVEL